MEKRGLKLKINNKGISPRIAIILLVSVLVIIVIMMVFLFISLSKEVITKMNKNISKVCKDVDFSVSYVNKVLTIKNIGDIPIYSFKIKTDGEEIEISGISRWPQNGLNPGDTAIIESDFGDGDISIIPELIGENEKGEQTIHICSKNYGKNL